MYLGVNGCRVLQLYLGKFHRIPMEWNGITTGDFFFYVRSGWGERKRELHIHLRLGLSSGNVYLVVDAYTSSWRIHRIYSLVYVLIPFVTWSGALNSIFSPRPFPARPPLSFARAFLIAQTADSFVYNLNANTRIGQTRIQSWKYILKEIKRAWVFTKSRSSSSNDEIKVTFWILVFLIQLDCFCFCFFADKANHMVLVTSVIQVIYLFPANRVYQ